MMTTKQRYDSVIKLLQQKFPNADTELMHYNDFELLVAVILSAQCTDKRVNEVTPNLFKNFPNAVSLSKATPEEVFPYISSISYPNSKAKYLVNCAKRLVEVYNGEIPSDAKELQTLQGVGRKTANVIQAIIFHKAAMPVDTHVHRVSRRIGLTNNATNVRQTEEQLMKNIPKYNVAKLHHQLILLGRYICKARKPLCSECNLQDFCKYFIANSKKQNINKIK